MKSWKVVVMVVLAALLLSACVTIVPSPSQETQNPYPDSSPSQKMQSPFPGNFAPDFNANTVNNETISLTEFRGQTTILNFWAMWCSPCRGEIPELNRFYKSYRSKVAILSVEVDGQRNALNDFLQSTPIGFPIVLNAEQGADIAELYQIRARHAAAG
ncbi:MAG: TlpA disulfide reductase family protein [Coprothermobacterota bacterium]|nr:TlpA disulfide reductase family protein [Coprothermobacterota bacterium]